MSVLRSTALFESVGNKVGMNERETSTRLLIFKLVKGLVHEMDIKKLVENGKQVLCKKKREISAVNATSIPIAYF